MLSSRTGLPRRPGGRRWSVQAGLAVLGLLASTGCQVEYAGMTLPSGKYMHDDVQYFAPGPEFPYANTQAATQRARMQAGGMPVPPVPGEAGPAGGAGLGGINAAGVPVAPNLGPGAIPRPGEAPEAEQSMPGGSAAPNAPVPAPPAPGGAVPAPPG